MKLCRLHVGVMITQIVQTERKEISSQKYYIQQICFENEVITETVLEKNAESIYHHQKCIKRSVKVSLRLDDCLVCESTATQHYCDIHGKSCIYTPKILSSMSLLMEPGQIDINPCRESAFMALLQTSDL